MCESKIGRFKIKIMNMNSEAADEFDFPLKAFLISAIIHLSRFWEGL